MKNLELVLLLFLLPAFTFAQDMDLGETEEMDTSSSSGEWSAGVFLGYSNYFGDLVEPTFTFDQANAAFGIFIKNQISYRFGLKANLYYSNIEGSDLNYDRNEGRGSSFESSLVELAVRGEYDFRRKKNYDYQEGDTEFMEAGTYKKKIVPYIFLGLGAAFVNPDVVYGAYSNGDDVADYSNVHLTVPVGLGVRIDLSRKMYLGLEWGERITFTDYMDGVSLSGNQDDNDVYATGGITLGMRFVDKDSDNDGVADDQDKCPSIPGPVRLGGCPDSDGDGLADRDDNCPNDPGDISHNGCPDSDGDGIADHVDDCPETAGLRRFSGCPDTDNDGIVDKEDSCPTTPGIPAMNGCPDSDRDGITDDKDGCPQTPGTAEHNGCPDSDDDGIADNEDTCPNTPGVRRFNGCPDTDNDGIADNEDKCPSLAGPASSDGCPEIAAEDKAVLDLAMQNVNFETGSARLLSASKRVLDQIAEIVVRYPGYNLYIDGYTDSQGNDFANQQLSENRVNSAADYLAGKGVSRSLMITKGHGENNPIADNSTASGRRKNRRVTFRLEPKQ
ncbi:MAG TPA: OmpA family protein [Bacteroidetes bacterium]|nr:OmpA family protein [Bacteroidota bacterium]